MTEKNTVQVVAPHGQMEQVAQALIRLADHPHDVVWASRGGYFEVPEQVAVRYAAEQGTEPAEAGDDETPVKPARSRRRAAAPKAAAGGAEPSSRRRASRKKKDGDS